MSRCFYCPVKGRSDYYTMVYGPEVEVPSSYYYVGQLRNYDAGYAPGNDCYHVKSKVQGFISPEGVIDVSDVVDTDDSMARYWKTELKGSPAWVTGLSPTKSQPFQYSEGFCQWWFEGLVNGSVCTAHCQWGYYTYWNLWKWDVDWKTNTATVWRSVEVTNQKYYETAAEAWSNPGPQKWQLYGKKWDINPYITETGLPSSASNAQSVALAECHNLLRFLENNISDIVFQMTSYGDLCQKAAENTQPNTTNAVALIMDIIRLPRDLDASFDLAESLGSWFWQFLKRNKAYETKATLKRVVKDAADMFLSTKYGPRLTYGDLGVMTNNILGNIPPKSKTSQQLDESVYVFGHKYTGYQRIQFNWTFTGINALAENLRQRNIKFDLTDAWDLVPYSFVVDWFFGVGDALEKFQTNERMSRLDVSNIWHTIKLNGSRTLEKEGSRYTINNTLYCRRNLPFLLPGSISPTSQPVAHQHIVEESALLVQRT